MVAYKLEKIETWSSALAEELNHQSLVHIRVNNDTLHRYLLLNNIIDYPESPTNVSICIAHHNALPTHSNKQSYSLNYTFTKWWFFKKNFNFSLIQI